MTSTVTHNLTRGDLRSVTCCTASSTDPTTPSSLRLWQPPSRSFKRGGRASMSSCRSHPRGNEPCNPSSFLVRPSLSRLNLVFAATAVRRVHDVPQLKNVHDYDERIRLLQGSHEVNRDIVQGRRVLLFDDLFRSGATMNEITSNLYDFGSVSDVYALTITCTRRV
jgi:hypothetical protein